MYNKTHFIIMSLIDNNCHKTQCIEKAFEIKEKTAACFLYIIYFIYSYDVVNNLLLVLVVY